MGCDIHGPFIEQVDWYVAAGSRDPREPGDPDAVSAWWRCVAELDWQRNYDVFQLIADVRCEDGSYDWCGKPEHPEPRGFPWCSGLGPSEGDSAPGFGVLSWQAKRHIYADDESGNAVHHGGCHSFTTLHLADLVEAQAAFVRQHKTPNADIALAITIMTAATLQRPDYEVRLLACFDS